MFASGQIEPARAVEVLRKGFTDSAAWRSAEFASLFRLEEGDRQAPVARVWLKETLPLPGLRYQTISARLIAGRIHSISIVIFDAGEFFGYHGSNLPGGISPEAAVSSFEAEYIRRRVDWVNFLQDLGVAPLG